VQKQTTDTQLDKSPTTATPKIKKPYVKPMFRYEKVFETQALSCSKIAVTSGTCQAGAQKTS
jgi:hypothetical protein